LKALSKPDDFILALVEIDGDQAQTLRSLTGPFSREPDFGVTGVNYNPEELRARAGDPR